MGFVSRPLEELSLWCCEDACEPASYKMDIEPDDIDMSDTVTVVWNIAWEEMIMMSSIFYGELFTDEVQADWGSFAYKCTKEQLRMLMQKTNCEIEKIDQLNPDQIYGIVFIEES